MVLFITKNKVFILFVCKEKFILPVCPVSLYFFQLETHSINLKKHFFKKNSRIIFIENGETRRAIK